MPFPDYPLETDAIDGTVSSIEHPERHNQLATAANWLNDQFTLTLPKWLSANGVAIVGSFAGEVTVITLPVPDYGAAGWLELSVHLFFSKNAADLHHVRLKLDGTTILVWRDRGTPEGMADGTRNILVGAGAHTVTVTLQRDPATSNGNAQTFADSTANRADAKFTATV